MAERIPESDYDQMHHFISVSPWDSFAVMETVAESVHATLVSGSSVISRGVIGVIVDESGWEKSGKKSVGVARQYIGQVGKIANGQVGVFAALSNGEQVGLLQGRLYLPQEWVSDKARCDKAGIPEEERLYRTKPELAVKILKTLPEAVRYDWVGGDSIYGNSPVLRQHLYSVKQSFVLDVGEELPVYLTPPRPYIPAKKSGRGRTPLQYVCDESPIVLRDLIGQIPDEQWKTITHRQGTKGPLIRKAVLLRVYIWNPKRPGVIESVQVLISTEPDGSEKKYSICWDKGNDMDLAIALYRQMQRYWVERAFQNVKEQLGLHQYQVRSSKAWHHHIALTIMALQFILEVQQENIDEMSLLSVPDIKLIFAKKLLNNLNSDDGLIHALNTRHRLRKRDIDWRVKVPK